MTGLQKSCPNHSLVSPMMLKSYFSERHSAGSKILGKGCSIGGKRKEGVKSGSGKQDKKLLPKCGSNGAWNNTAMEQAEAAILENIFSPCHRERALITQNW